MGSNAEAVSKKLEEIPLVQWLVGSYAGRTTGGMVQVDFGEGPVTVLTTGFTEPLLGQSVRCLRTTDTTIMVGLAIPRSEIGQVTATGTPNLTVTTSLGSESMPRISTYSAVIGDNVLISPGGVVIGKVTAVPAGTYVPPTPETKGFSADFPPTDSGSYAGGWKINDVWASDSYKGAWFYQSTIPDTIPDSATITRVQVYLTEFYNPYPGELAAVSLHGDTGKGPTFPTVSATFQIGPGSGWFDLPTSWGDALKAAAAYGVGIQQSSPGLGYHKFYGTQSDSQSGMLRINWTA